MEVNVKFFLFLLAFSPAGTQHPFGFVTFLSSNLTGFYFVSIYIREWFRRVVEIKKNMEIRIVLSLLLFFRWIRRGKIIIVSSFIRQVSRSILKNRHAINMKYVSNFGRPVIRNHRHYYLTNNNCTGSFLAFILWLMLFLISIFIISVFTSIDNGSIVKTTYV